MIRVAPLSLAIHTAHHWSDLERGFREVARVARKRAVLLTWVPDAAPFWLTDDYFPEIAVNDRTMPKHAAPRRRSRESMPRTAWHGSVPTWPAGAGPSEIANSWRWTRWISATAWFRQSEGRRRLLDLGRGVQGDQDDLGPTVIDDIVVLIAHPAAADTAGQEERRDRSC